MVELGIIVFMFNRRLARHLVTAAVLAPLVATAAPAAADETAGSGSGASAEVGVRYEGKDCDAQDGTVAISVSNNGSMTGYYEMRATFGPRKNVASAAETRIAPHDHRLVEVSWPYDRGRLKLTVWERDADGNRVARTFTRGFAC